MVDGHTTDDNAAHARHGASEATAISPVARGPGRDLTADTSGATSTTSTTAGCRGRRSGQRCVGRPRGAASCTASERSGRMGGRLDVGAGRGQPQLTESSAARITASQVGRGVRSRRRACQRDEARRRRRRRGQRGAACVAGIGRVIRPAVVVRTGSHSSGAASRDPGAFIPRGVRACVSSASSPTYGGAVGCCVGQGASIGSCGTCFLGGAPLLRNPPSARSFRSYPLICGIVAALCLLVSHSWGQRCDRVGIVIMKKG